MRSVTTVRTANGNRLALVGAILYLLEWAFIIPSGVRPPMEGSAAAEIVAAYAAQPLSGIAFMFAGLCVALLGRIAFSAGVRNALRQTNETRSLADFAFGAMVVSVVLELASEVLRIVTTQLAAQDADSGLVVALHEIGRGLFFPVGAALGTAILASSLAMLLSRDFPRWLGLLGVVTGGLWIGSAFYMALNNAVIGALTGPAWLAWAVWLLSTGIILFRRAGPLALRRSASRQES